MMTITRRAALAAAGAGAMAGLARPADATIVDRPVRALVGYAAGGPTDTLARLYAEALRGSFAPQVVIENRPGAGGRLAPDLLRQAPPDGSVMLVAPGSIVTLTPHVYASQVRYDALVDFVPVATLGTFSVGIAVPAAHPAKDFAELVTWMRAQKDDITFGSPAAGSGPHFVGGRLGSAVGVSLTHIPYRGATPAVQDLLGGRLPMMVAVLSDLIPQHGSGLRILVVSSPRRIARLPDVPTFAEVGYPALTAEDWIGVFLPAKTPEPIVTGLHQAIVAAAATEGVRGGLQRLQFGADVLDPAALAARIRSERDGWGPVVRESGFKPDD